MVYWVECLLCGALYTGTTWTSLDKRVMAHQLAVRREERGNAVEKHFALEHGEVGTCEGEPGLFKVQILGVPTLRGSMMRGSE